MPSSSISSLKSLLTSSLSSHSTDTSQSAYITFNGPDSSSQITATTPSNNQPVAQFTVSSSTFSSTYTISRILPPNPQPTPICQLKRSSLSGTTTLHIHGQEIRLAKNHFSSSGNDAWKMETSTHGTLKWAKGTLRGITLSDNVGTVVAKGSLSNAQLDVLVQADEMFLDIIMAAWVGLVKGKAAEDKEAKGAMEVVNALAGG